MQKFNVNYNYINNFCNRNGIRPIAERGRYFVTDEMKKQLTKAKELIGELISSLSVVGKCEEECELLNRTEQFLREVGDDSKRFEKCY